MSRGLCSVLLALAGLFAAGCSGDDTAAQTTTGQTTVVAGSAGEITLRVARGNDGPWVRSLSLEHGPDGQPTAFYACAAWDEARPPQECAAAPGAKLPEGMTLRLEQRPAGTAMTIPESPGWGTVGSTDRTELHVPLSDFVVGLAVRKATYRVTLRVLEGGPALAMSNAITVTWAT